MVKTVVRFFSRDEVLGAESPRLSALHFGLHLVHRGDQETHPARCIVTHRVRDVPILIHRKGYRGVSKCRGYRLNIRAVLNGKGSKRMPQIVKTHIIQSDRPDDLLEVIVERMNIDSLVKVQPWINHW